MSLQASLQIRAGVKKEEDRTTKANKPPKLPHFLINEKESFELIDQCKAHAASTKAPMTCSLGMHVD